MWVSGFRFRVQGSGLGFRGLRFRVKGVGFRVSRCRVQGSGQYDPWYKGLPFLTYEHSPSLLAFICLKLTVHVSPCNISVTYELVKAIDIP